MTRRVFFITGISRTPEHLSRPANRRKPLAWLWDFNDDQSSWNDDADLLTPKKDITEEDRALKLHFDQEIEKKLPDTMLLRKNGKPRRRPPKEESRP
ncbi:hypothetical protein RUND412_003756 [Rhizina undulata]